jgi:hypothetical protein
MLATKLSLPRDPEDWEVVRRMRAHAQRCRALPPLRPGEVERLIAEYAARHGSITRCPTAYLIPIQQ